MASYIGSHKITLGQFKGFNQELLKALNGAVICSNPVSAVLPTAGWVADAEDASGCKYRYDLPVEGLTAANLARVNVFSSSLEAARDCGLSSKNETIAGYIRFRAISIPEEALSIRYWIESVLNITMVEEADS